MIAETSPSMCFFNLLCYFFKVFTLEVVFLTWSLPFSFLLELFSFEEGSSRDFDEVLLYALLSTDLSTFLIDVNMSSF